jgi:hypothetical protein
MRCFTKLWCATLLIAFAGIADTGGKSPSDGKTVRAAHSASSAGWSSWQSLFIVRDGVVNPSKPKDFEDTRFEYRWKSEWVVSAAVCTIEVRPVDDLDVSYTAPEIGIGYRDKSYGRPRGLKAQNVLITKSAHAFLRPGDCKRVEQVYWTK